MPRLETAAVLPATYTGIAGHRVRDNFRNPRHRDIEGSSSQRINSVICPRVGAVCASLRPEGFPPVLCRALDSRRHASQVEYTGQAGQGFGLPTIELGVSRLPRPLEAYEGWRRVGRYGRHQPLAKAAIERGGEGVARCKEPESGASFNSALDSSGCTDVAQCHWT
jgi:hypothetical protein